MQERGLSAGVGRQVARLLGHDVLMVCLTAAWGLPGGCRGAPYHHSCHRRQRCSYPSRSEGGSEVAAEAAVGGAVGAGTQDEGRSHSNP